MLHYNPIFFPNPAPELFDTRKTRDDFKLTPEKMDFEMPLQTPSDFLHIHWPTQDALEHFVRHYAHSYKVLWIDGMYLKDLSPLGDLPNLEALLIDYSRADKLWDMSRNTSLKILDIRSCKKLVATPMELRTSKTLEEIYFYGADFDNKHTLESLSCFAGMESLRRIELYDIKLKEKNFDILSSLPNLEEFHFDPGMLTTEEIAWICAKYPHLYGYTLRPYGDEYLHRWGEVRVCGHRKPTLTLPQQQKQLDRYVAQFNALVEKYRKDL